MQGSVLLVRRGVVFRCDWGAGKLLDERKI